MTFWLKFEDRPWIRVSKEDYIDARLMYVGTRELKSFNAGKYKGRVIHWWSLRRTPR